MGDLPAWGIHVTTSSLRAAKLVKVGEEVHVVAYDQLDFTEDIEDVNSLDRLGPQLHALNVFQKRHNLTKSRVFVSADGVTAFNRYVAAPLVHGESLSRILAYEAQQQIPFDLEDVYWDFKSLDVRQEDGEADVLLFAVKREVVDERIRRFQKMHIPLDGVQLSPLALYNWACREHLVKDGVAIVSVDIDRIEILICFRGRFWFRILPTGTHVLHAELREALGVKHRQVVKILRGEESCPDAEVKAEVMETVGRRLARQVAQTLAYYEGAIDGLRMQGVVFLPTASIVPPMAGALGEETGLKIYGAKSFRHLKIAEEIITPELGRSVAPLAHAVGLALQGLGEAEVAVRLYPHDLERVISGRRIFWVLSALVLLLFVGIAAFQSRRHVEDVRDMNETLASRTGELEAGRLKYREISQVDRIKAAILPYREAGRHRLAPVRAADLVLTLLDDPSKNPKDAGQVHLLGLDTGLSDSMGMGSPGRREVSLLLGVRQNGSREEALALLRSRFLEPLASDWRIKDLKEGEDYAASSLSFGPTPDIETKELRRRFLMLRVSFVHDDEMHAMGEGGGR